MRPGEKSYLRWLDGFLGRVVRYRIGGSKKCTISVLPPPCLPARYRELFEERRFSSENCRQIAAGPSHALKIVGTTQCLFPDAPNVPGWPRDTQPRPRFGAAPKRS